MDWQLLLVSLCVALAAAYLANQTWRSWRGRRAGCGGSCASGCGGSQRANSAGENTSEAPLISVAQLTARLRQRR
jgi:hypothetical protein